MMPEPSLRTFLWIGLFVAAAAPAQTLQPARALRLAESGRCIEALPLLKTTAAQTPNQRREFGLAGLKCALALNKIPEVLSFAQTLQKEAGDDPEILYVLTHAYSDLSVRTSQRLLATAPRSYQVRQLNAEALEAQGRWDDAAKEYQAVLATEPKLPGIHFRIGRLLLSKQPATAEQTEQAKKEFEAEIQINPKHAGAQFVLGELARREDRFDEAITYFGRAVEYDAGNAEAHLGLGRSYMGAERYKDAIPPLETSARLQPENPETHFQLAIAYGRDGRKEDSAREAALHKEMTARAQQRRDDMQKALSH